MAAFRRTNDETSKEIEAQPVSRDVEVSAQPMELQQWYLDNFPATAFDPVIAQQAIIANILQTDAADVLNLKESLDSARVLQNRPLQFVGIDSVMPSDFGGVYLVCTIVLLDEGEKKQISIGSPTILAQLKVIYEHDADPTQTPMLPLECKIAPIRRGGKNGHNPPLYLRPLNY